MKIEVVGNSSFFVIPEFIIQKYKLRRLDHEVFGKVLSLSLKNGCCIASNKYIGTCLESTKESISKSIGRLEKAGLLINQLKYDKNHTQVINRYLVPNMDNKDVYDYVTEYYKDYNIANFKNWFKSFNDYIQFFKSCITTEEAAIILKNKGSHGLIKTRGIVQTDYRCSSNELEGMVQTDHRYSTNEQEGIVHLYEYNNKDKNTVNNIDINKDNNNVCSINKLQLSLEERNLLYKDYPEALVTKKINEYEKWKDKIKPKNIKSDYVEIRKWIDKASTNCNGSIVNQLNVDEVTDEQLQNINF